ncbi:MAG: DNA methyltransferase, partial [Fimbriimonadaceae bacterium]
MARWQVLNGNCLDVMREMANASIDAVVTDPPYGLGFMGKEWDKGVPGVPFWAEALRIAKPGAHLLAFGGTRTYHRLACAIEDAGWEIRDCVMWVYGSGYPKSLDVSKAIDKAAGVEREVIGSVRTNVGMQGGNFTAGSQSADVPVTAPATDAAR